MFELKISTLNNICKLVYVNTMVITNEKKKFKQNIKDSHKIKRKNNKRRNEHKELQNNQ